MKFYSAPFDKILVRFYLMMTFALVPFFIGIPYLAILSVPFFLAAMTGIEFNSANKNTQQSVSTFTTSVNDSNSKQAA